MLQTHYTERPALLSQHSRNEKYTPDKILRPRPRQKGVDGRSQWRTGTRETEVRLDGWCEGGLRQQKNDGGGCGTMRERPERVESTGTYVTE